MTVHERRALSIYAALDVLQSNATVYDLPLFATDPVHPGMQKTLAATMKKLRDKSVAKYDSARGDADAFTEEYLGEDDPYTPSEFELSMPFTIGKYG